VTRLGGAEGGLVDEVAQVGADHPRRRRGQALEVDVVGQRDRARVDLEDLLAAFDVGWVDRDAAVEATGAQQRRIEDIGSVGRGQDDDAF